MKVSFVDLKRQNKLHHKEFLRVISSVIKHASFTMGAPLDQFETAFAKFCGTKYCIGVNSGTDAIEFALLAHEIGPYDEVITAPNGYFSTAMVISKVGASPVFADIDPNTFNIDPIKVESRITKNTRAIIPVHFCGQPADMDPLIKLAKKYHLPIIEDCCQAHGAKYKNKTVPVTGLGAFSFFPGKNLGAFGDGGALVTNNRKIASIVKKLRNDGALKKYHHEVIGSKSRLHSIHAAILSQKLKHLKNWNSLRRKHAGVYNQLLRNTSEIKTPHESKDVYHVYHLYMVEARKRDQLQKFLASHNIDTVIHYPTPIHLQPAYKDSGFKPGDFPETEKKANQILSLPIFPEMKPVEIKYVASRIKQFYS